GDVEVLNPLGAGVLENTALRTALPDLCRQILHEDLVLRSPAPGTLPEPATWLSTDPGGGDDLVKRPLQLHLLVIAGEGGFRYRGRRGAQPPGRRRPGEHGAAHRPAGPVPPHPARGSGAALPRPRHAPGARDLAVDGSRRGR